LEQNFAASPTCPRSQQMVHSDSAEDTTVLHTIFFYSYTKIYTAVAAFSLVITMMRCVDVLLYVTGAFYWWSSYAWHRMFLVPKPCSRIWHGTNSDCCHKSWYYKVRIFYVWNSFLSDWVYLCKYGDLVVIWVISHLLLLLLDNHYFPNYKSQITSCDTCLWNQLTELFVQRYITNMLGYWHWRFIIKFPASLLSIIS